jgi:DNA-binding beta-propeller fold protein YncE
VASLRTSLLWVGLSACVTTSATDVDTHPADTEASNETDLVEDTELLDDTEVLDTEVVDTETSDTDVPFDELSCDNLAEAPLTGVWLRYTPACEDFTFDGDGNHVAVAGSGLVSYTAKAPNSTTQEGPRIPGSARGTRFLPNGHLLVADPDSGTVWRMVPGGGRELAASIAQPNGIVVGADGTAFISSSIGIVHRIDGATGVHTELIDVSVSTDGIALSPDEDILYVNTEFGGVKSFTLGPNDEPGPVLDFAQIPTGLSLLDGMTTDMCGNLYVTVMSGKVWRVTPDGDAELLITVPGGLFSITPALNFGSGHGGWSRTSLYITSFTGGVYEVEIGVPGRMDPNW